MERISLRMGQVLGSLVISSLIVLFCIIPLYTKATSSQSPINTYDISCHPKYISSPESPIISFDNEGNTVVDSTGDLQIVKVYANGYRATSSNRYTRIVPVSPLGISLDTSSMAQHFYGEGLSRKVYITDESMYTGYKLVAWQGSPDVEHGARSVKEDHGEYSADEWVTLDTSASVLSTSNSNNSNHKDGYPLKFEFNHRNTSSCYYDPNETSHAYNLSYTVASGYLDVPSDVKTLYILYIKDMPAISTDGSIDDEFQSPSKVAGTYNTQQPTGLLGFNTTINPIHPEYGETSISYNSLNIVKLYGTMDDATYQVSHDATYVRNNTTFNVRLEDEVEYNIKAYALVAEQPDLNYTSTEWCDGVSSNDITTQNEIDDHGFLDGFDKKTSSYRSSVNTPKPLGYGYINEVSSSNRVYPGDTLYFGDIVETGRVATLYILYIKSVDNSVNDDHDLIITESYITKRIKLSEAGVEVSEKPLNEHNFSIWHPSLEHVMSLHTKCPSPIYKNWTDWGGNFVEAQNNIVLYETEHNINHVATDGNGNSGYNDGILEGLSRLFINEVAPCMVNPNNVLVGNHYPVKDRLSVNFTPTPNAQSYSYSSAHWRGTLDDYNIRGYSIIINGVDMSLVVHRTGDVVTLADWKNRQDTNTLYKMNDLHDIVGDNNVKISNQPQGLRKTNSLKFNNNLNTGGYRFVTNFGFKVDNTETYSSFKRSFNADAAYTIDGETWGATGNLAYDESQDIEIEQGIKYYSYVGKSSLSSDPSSLSGVANNVLDGTRITGDKAISFYPYIQMYYDGKIDWAKEAGAAAKSVYVVGEHMREVTPDSYVGVIINPTVDSGINIVNTVDNINTVGKIGISSHQWSTHATANNTIGFQNCVLPGGAMFNATIAKNARQNVIVETMTPVLTGDGLEQVDKTVGASGINGIPTDTTYGANEHNDIVNSVITGLEGLNIEQYVIDITNNKKETVLPSEPVYSNGIKVVVSKDDDSIDGKYYLREDSDLGALGESEINSDEPDPANTADLDAHETAITCENYTFSVGVDGWIYCNGTKILDAKREKPSVNSDYSRLSGNAWRVAKATGIVEKLYYGLELGSGNDINNLLGESSEKWYNEAFDGITYVYRRSTVEVGFINPYERSCVLDPALTPEQSSKEDMLTRYVATQFATSKHSAAFGNEEGMIAIYNNTPIYVDADKLQRLFISDIFFIPNMTVQDLK